MTSLMTYVVASCLILSGADGSDILFNCSSSFVKPLVSSNLTMTCKIVDTAPTGPAIGKRSVPRGYVEEAMRREDEPNDDVTMPDDLRDPSDLDVQNKTKKSVSHTDDNVRFVTSILISRDGVDVASISDHFGVRQLVKDVMVTGQLTGVHGVGGELQITWPHPTPSEAGEYRCDVDTFSAQAHSIIFSQTINIAEAEVSMSELVNEVHRLKLEKEQMEKTMTNTFNKLDLTDQTFTNSIQQLTLTDKTITNTLNKLDLTDQTLNNSIQQLTLTDKTMNSTINNVNQSLTSLSNVARVEPNVLFSAINSQDRSLSQNEVLIFDKILTSEGHGYDNNTGVFTAPLAGFYMFHVHIVSDYVDTFTLALQHNGNAVIHLYTYGDDTYDTDSDSVILKLSHNDQVKVVSVASSSDVDGQYGYYTATVFTGRLVSL